MATDEGAKKHLEEMVAAEQTRDIQRQRRQEEEEDRRREYWERRSKYEEEMPEETQEYEENFKQISKQRVKDHLEKAVKQKDMEGNYYQGYEFVAYLFEGVADKENFINQLSELIDQSDAAADIIEKLVAGGKGIHANEVELLKLGAYLRHEAKKHDKEAVVNQIIPAISRQIKSIIRDKFEQERINAAAQGQPPPRRVPYWLLKKNALHVDLSETQRNALVDEAQWEQTIDDLLIQDLPERADVDLFSDDGQLTQGQQPPPQIFKEEVDKIFRDIKQREKAGTPMTSEELKTKEREIQELKSKSYPTDVAPNTNEFDRVVGAIDNYTEDRLNEMAQVFEARIRQEGPKPEEGRMTDEEFLARIGEQPGRLGMILQYNPHIRNKLIDPKEVRFRNLVFLTILGPVLTQKNDPTQETYGLYERADMITFVNTLRAGMGKLRKKDTMMPYGQTWVDWYQNLNNAIRNARDIDYYANQAGADMKSFFASVSRYQNQFTSQALSFPAVEAGFRAYEATLRAIKSYNDGYIPPSLIEYNFGRMGSMWDIMAQNFLTQMIDQGVVKDIKRDPQTGFHLLDKNGRTLVLGEALDKDKLKKEDPFDLEINMYLTLAKGFGMISWHLLEKFGTSRCPGSDHPIRGMPENFHSLSYESVSRAVDFFGYWITKWKFGSPKYFHFVNMLLPEAKRRKKWTFDEAKEAYMAYRDGTFEQKYGKEAKRFIDLNNFSHFSANLPYSSWRHLDTTIGWSDKQREYMGGSAQILLADKFAADRVKDYLVVHKYREEFRKRMKQVGRPDTGVAFDKLWRSEGLKIYGGQIDNDWDAWRGRHLMGKNIPGGKKLVSELVEVYKKAFVARKWVEMAMKNPLGIAHNIEVEVPIAGYKAEKKTKKVKLNSLIVQEVLGIPLQDLAYGEIPGSSEAAYGATPTEDQYRWMSQAMALETDIASVRERALVENRELTEKDFCEVIGKGASSWSEVPNHLKPRVKHALRYWEITRQTILGTTDATAYKDLYKELGLSFTDFREGQYYDVDWDKVKGIDKILEEIGRGAQAPKLTRIDGRQLDIPFRLNKEWVEKVWEWQMDSDDTSYRMMDMLNLGARQWIRRAGDAAAHYAGGERLGLYITDDIKKNSQPEDLAKALFEVRKAYEGDDIAYGWRAAHQWAYLTGKLYAFDYKKLASPAQLNIWGTRKGVAAWHANARRKFVDTLGNYDVLPPLPDDYYTFSMQEGATLKELKEQLKATSNDVWIEFLLLGYLLALAITLYRAFTAKSEEEES